MRKLSILCLLTIGISLVGCSVRGVDKSDPIVAYNINLSELNNVDSHEILDRYTEAIMFIVSDDIIYRDYIEENREKFKDTIDDLVFTQLLSKATEDTTPTIDLTNEEYLSNPYNNIDLEVDEEGDYPIYGTHYVVSKYGTREEAQEALDLFNSTPTNTIVYSVVYRDGITLKLDNKYTGGYALKIGTENGKITTVYRFE